MRNLFCAVLLLPCIFCPLVIADDVASTADDRSGHVAAGDNREFTATVRILEGSRKNLAVLGFDASKGKSEQVSPLSPREFRSQLKELQKLGQMKVLAEPALSISLNKATRSFSGGEIAVPTVGSDGRTEQRWVEIGTKVEMTPSLLPDGRLSLQQSVSHATFRYTNASRLFRKKVPVVSRWQSEGNLVVPDDRIVFVVPEDGLDQEDILVLQFDVAE